VAGVLSDRILVPFQRPRAMIGPATQVRSTLLAASVETVRQRGRFDEYVSLMSTEHRDQVVLGVAGVWLPMAVAVAHYVAIDALGFTDAEAVANGYAAGGRLNDTFLGAALKVASHVGATPWLPLEQTGKLFERVFRGGAGLQVEHCGPKEARIEIVGVPLLESPYFRGALRGQVQAGCELFCQRCYAREVGRRTAPGCTTLRVSWV
jgi:hypothetical protein